MTGGRGVTASEPAAHPGRPAQRGRATLRDFEDVLLRVLGRLLLGAILGLLLGGIVGLSLTAAARVAAAEEKTVRAVAAVGMTVADMDRSLAFYEGALDFERVADVVVSGEAYDRLHRLGGLRMRVVRLRLGQESLELREYLAPHGRPVPADSRSNDRWFQHIAIITTDMDRAYERLRAEGVAHVSTGPQRLPDWNAAAGGIRAFYFRDPDGHVLEILQFPPAKGAAKWHQPGGALFRGIDHTAIVVGDTAQSLDFYRGLLGLTVAGGSENYGPEQERLNGLPGARLRITTLRAAAGPGIELLDYLAPDEGRPYPADSSASDLWHWETRLVSPDVDVAFARLQATRPALISPGVVTLPDGALGFPRALLVRDPDGHALALVPGEAARP
jgi:catechol 2,3-dioxygenase-like lactoylglutathione lyase family enzyme